MEGEQPDMDQIPDLNKGEIINLYKEKSEEANMEPHGPFLVYLEETYDENDSLDLVLPGNDKLMFNDRITDDHLIVICRTLERYAIYIEEIDLRYNQITDLGARMLADLIKGSERA
jgi:hypothetical protein